jgi:hypothetical protein
VNKVCTYKGGKYHEDATVTMKRLAKPFYLKTIGNVSKSESWESLRGGAYKLQKQSLIPELFKFFPKKYLDSLSFEPKLPTVVRLEGNDYYKLDARVRNYQVSIWVDAKTNLFYKFEDVALEGSKKGYKSTEIYLDYLKVGNIMIPQRVLKDTVSENGDKSQWEFRFNNFVFNDDISDSLFEVPKR